MLAAFTPGWVLAYLCIILIVGSIAVANITEGKRNRRKVELEHEERMRRLEILGDRVTYVEYLELDDKLKEIAEKKIEDK